jgi:hypothetical protein
MSGERVNASGITLDVQAVADADQPMQRGARHVATAQHAVIACARRDRGAAVGACPDVVRLSIRLENPPMSCG